MSGDKLLKEMGERIYDRRKNLGFTQEELAEKLGVSTQMISNLELGKKAIRPENLVKLCTALDVSADFCLFGGDRNHPTDDLYLKLLKLNADERRIITSLLDYMNAKK